MGLYIAKAVGTRIYSTEDGKNVGVKIDKYPGLWVCKMGPQTLFEIHQQSGDSFKTMAELYTPDGSFIKCSDQAALDLMNNKGEQVKLSGFVMSGSTFINIEVAIWLKKNGGFTIG